MSDPASVNSTAMPIKLLLIANLLFWIYFGVAFARASYPFSRDVWNYTAPTAPAGYTFFGHSIGVRESAFEHPFFRSMFYVEFPSFAIARLGQNLLLPNITGDRFFAGISEGGWRIVVTVMLSFIQWYFLGRLGHKLFRKRARRSAVAEDQISSNQTRG